MNRFDIKTPKKILIVRNDRLGDFMLAYPSFALLKQNLKEAKVYALVPSYTMEMADLCPWIDRVLIDPEPRDKWHSSLTLVKMLRDEQFDAIITLFSTTRVGLAAYFAKIPYRLAPATKIAQIFYNHRFLQRRSRSEKPEYDYNQDLVRYYLKNSNMPIFNNPKPPFLNLDDNHTRLLKSTFCQTHEIDPQHRLVFIHPGSGGSANNLSIDQYGNLARCLKSRHGHTIVITSGPSELERAKTLSGHLKGLPHTLYHSVSGLESFARHIQFAHLFISGSTGPLHIAGALDVPTAAFYPRRRSAISLRWQTLNSPSHRISFSEDDATGPGDMQGIDVDKAAQLISERYL